MPLEGPRKPGGLALSSTQQFLVHTDNVNLLGENVHTIKKKQVLLVTSNETGLNINAEEMCIC